MPELSFPAADSMVFIVRGAHVDDLALIAEDIKGLVEGHYAVEVVYDDFVALVRAAQALLDVHYPADVFVGRDADADRGVRFVTQLRDALRCINAEPLPELVRRPSPVVRAEERACAGCHEPIAPGESYLVAGPPAHALRTP